jgi:hypothetical protein
MGAYAHELGARREAEVLARRAKEIEQGNALVNAHTGIRGSGQARSLFQLINCA